MRLIIIGAVAAGTSAAAKARRNSEDAEIVIYEKDSCIPHAKIRTTAEELDKDVTAITYCNKGTTGNAAQNILLGKGFKKVYNLSGGQKQYGITHNEK